MIRFKQKALEKLLEARKPQISPPTYMNLKRTIDQGAEGIDPNTLSRLCRELECLPVDIVEFV